MNSATRLLVGLGAVGGVGGAAYLLQTQLYTDSIEKKLLAEKYEILDDENKEWETILASYRDTVSKNIQLKFGNFEGKEGEKEKLIKECKDTLKKAITDKDSYQRAKHWCIVPITLESTLKKEGFKVLSTKTDNDDLDKQAWINKLADHVKKDQKFENKKFTGIANIPVDGTAKNAKENIDAIKKECEKLNKKKHYEVDFKENTDKAMLWCVIKEQKRT